MSWIRSVPPEQATGPLRDLYDRMREHSARGVISGLWQSCSLDARGLQVRVGAGEVRLDLRPTRLTGAENTIYVKVGLGDGRIDVPRDLPVSIDARTGGGDLHLLGRESDGFAARLDFKDPGYDAAARKLRLTIRVGLGDVQVRRN